ncbi:MAG: hypothetical protein V4603_14370 [Pseudomonadota bacterium]
MRYLVHSVSRKRLLGCGLLLTQVLAHAALVPFAVAQEQEPNLDLLVFDAVPLNVEPSVDAAAAALVATGAQPPYQASELVIPPRDNPQPVTVAIQQQVLQSLTEEETAAITDIERREAQLKQMEQSGDAYSNELAEVLMDLATDYESAGDFLGAQTLYERANHIVRVNYGLFSAEQIPVVKRMFNNYLMSGDLYAADQQQEYLYYLQRKIHGDDTANLIPPLQEYAEWNVQAFLSYVPAALPSPATETDTAEQASVPPPPPPSNTVPDLLTFRIQHLLNAQLLYQQLIELLLATTHRSDPRLPEAERSLAVTSYLFATQAVMMDPSIDAQTGLYTDMPMRRSGYSEGRKSLERRISYLQQNTSTSPAELAHARLELVDWMIATHTRSDFAKVFNGAYGDYVASGATAEQVASIFYPPLPIQVPTFIIRPYTRQGLGIPIEAALKYQGYIDVEYGVSKIGDSLSPKILYRTPETPDAVEEVLLRSLRRAEFRPRMKDGELVDDDRITARYYYAY